jgi:hypothetical protein
MKRRRKRRMGLVGQLSLSVSSLEVHENRQIHSKNIFDFSLRDIRDGFHLPLEQLKLSVGVCSPSLSAKREEWRGDWEGSGSGEGEGDKPQMRIRMMERWEGTLWKH